MFSNLAELGSNGCDGASETEVGGEIEESFRGWVPRADNAVRIDERDGVADVRQGAYGLGASLGRSASLLFVPVEPVEARRDAKQEQEGDRERDQASAEEDDQGDDVRVVLLVASSVENADGIGSQELGRLAEAVDRAFPTSTSAAALCCPCDPWRPSAISAVK